MIDLFKGIRVLDFSTVLAGPSVATFFAELGASVIKIENPKTRGDVTRSWKLAGEDPASAISSYFASVNYNKTYLNLDAGDPQTRTQIEQLIQESDIVIFNFKHGDDIKFRLAPNDVRKIKKDIIYARVEGFDSDPERVAYDVVLQAETGYMYMNGTEESGPVKMPVAIMDVLAAHQLKEGILCALLKRMRSGEGSLVSCSLEKAGLSGLVNQASNYLMTGHIPQRMGSLHPNIAPYGETFSCADNRYIVLAVGSDKQFQNLCAILGAPELSEKPEFLNNAQRVRNRIQLKAELTPYFKKFDSVHLLNQMIKDNVPSGAIKSMEEVMKNAVASGMILEEKIEGVQTKRMQSAAFTISDL